MRGATMRLSARDGAFLGGGRVDASTRAGARAHPRTNGASAVVAVGRVRLDVRCMAKSQELAGKWCRLTGKKADNGYRVSHSHVRTKRLQHVNLHVKRVYWARGKRWVKLKISAKAIKTIEKIGLEAAAKKAGIDLASLPFTLDETEQRRQWKRENASRSTPKDSRRMMNLEKLAASDHPLSGESRQLLDKLRPDLTGDARSDAALLNLRKLSLSDHALAPEAKQVLKRNLELGDRLALEKREKKNAERYGYVKTPITAAAE